MREQRWVLLLPDCVNNAPTTLGSRRQPPYTPGNRWRESGMKLGEVAGVELAGSSHSHSHGREPGLATSRPLRKVWDSGSGQGGRATPGAKPKGWQLFELSAALLGLVSSVPAGPILAVQS